MVVAAARRRGGAVDTDEYSNRRVDDDVGDGHQQQRRVPSAGFSAVSIVVRSIAAWLACYLLGVAIARWCRYQLVPAGVGWLVSWWYPLVWYGHTRSSGIPKGVPAGGTSGTYTCVYVQYHGTRVLQYH